jgi:hypothetical protein
MTAIPAELQELFEDINAELDPALKPWIIEDGLFGPCLKHPLVFEIIYHPHRNAMINRLYHSKLEALAKAEEAGRWNSYVFLHERPHRLEALFEIEGGIEDREYWTLLGQIWTDSENVWQHADEWREALSDPRGEREYMMVDYDREALAQFPSTLQVYRGYNGDGTAEGMSWTLNKAQARWFSKRFEEHRGAGRIAEGTVAQSDVLAYHSTRNESEIVVFPENVWRA